MAGPLHGHLEGSGRFRGYEDILDALEDPSRPDHAQHFGWAADVTGSAEPFYPAFLNIPA
jgi:hypothetical protein